VARLGGFDLDLSRIQDAGVREVVVRLLNVVEELAADNRELRAENQRLRDENARLKGEQGRPTIPPAVPAGGADHSSEAERRQPRARTKRSKKRDLRIDRTELVRVDRATLPADARFKGYADVVIQDLIVRADTIRFRRETFYSPTTGRTYRAALPAGYRGQFGPGLKALVLALAYAGLMSEAAILTLLRGVGVQISAGQVSNLLIKGHAEFHGEKAAVYEAGLRSSAWQHGDDTATRVNGQNWHCHVMDNPLYAAYFTRPRKDRLTVLDVLRGGAARTFRVNAEALSYLATLGAPPAVTDVVAGWPRDQDLPEDAVEELLAAELPRLGDPHRRWVREALAVAAYQARTDWPVVDTLVCDDAPQFKGLTEGVALCWVHEGRHYKKLTPCLAYHERLLRRFRARFWAFYAELLAYRERPTPADRRRLDRRFDRLFAAGTGYRALDAQIARTRAKKPSLLAVLAHPELPLHNNPAELAARRRVRKRDASFGPRTPDGVEAWDTFQSLVATAQKLGVSFYHFLQDRLTQAGQIPPLARLIEERAPALRLDASWSPRPCPQLLS
jgi:hypothetical protein